MTENAQRMQTRAAARKSRAESKRAAVAEAVQPAPPAKKRRALGSLPNNAPGNASVSQQSVITDMHTEGAVSGVQTRAAAKGKQQKLGGFSQSDENAVPGTVTSQRIRTDEKRPLRDITGFAAHCRRDLKKITTFVVVPREQDQLGGLPKGVNNIDDLHGDPQMCSTYAPEIFEHIRMSELKRRYDSNYMEGIQSDINASMRGILVDWLVEVAEEYKLVPDTLYLTVAYVDQYLSANRVTRQRLQLLGVSCMLIASKYEEICAPQVEDFCYITDNTYTKEEVLDMERRVLKHLGFDLSVPTTKTFLRRYIRAAQSAYKVPSLQFEFLGNYLAELTLLEYSFLRFPPSTVAASAVFLARLTIDPSSRPWTATLLHYSGYWPSQLEECVKALHGLVVKSSTLQGVREKYKQHKFKNVASLKPPEKLSMEYFGDHLES